MEYKACTNINCNNEARTEAGLLPASVEYFYLEKRRPPGLHSRCKQCCLQNMKKYRDNNKEKVALCKKKSYDKKPEYYIAKAQKWVEENREQSRRVKNSKERWKLKNDPEFRIVFNLRRRLRSAMKGVRKTKTTRDLIGCTSQELRMHLESLFQPGMSWDNYGTIGWHIDHIIPCSSFDLINEDQQRKCFNYMNLQPLWAVDNLKKNNKMNYFAGGNING